MSRGSVLACRWALTAALPVMAAIPSAWAADTSAGKTLAQQQQCATCHQPADWQGSSAGQIQDKISGVVAGKLKHPKKLDLTPAQIADIAAYWASAASQ
ncbi:MAG TPA: hypothetical protein VMD56_14065 [Steroidobacteraceae bacterium]|nr:hypothetical protein [Steroidobacteraceae bacterium]